MTRHPPQAPYCTPDSVNDDDNPAPDLSTFWGASSASAMATAPTACPGRKPICRPAVIRQWHARSVPPLAC